MAQLQRLVIAPSQLKNQQLTLTSAQLHYLTRVLRLRSGDRFIALDGQGHCWVAELKPALVPAQILEAIPAQTELPRLVGLMAAPPKGNGFDQVVHCATELGVSWIMPVLSDRTLISPSPQKLERWRRIAQEAAEQSERQIVPQVLEPLSFGESLQQCYQVDCDKEAARYLCVTRQPAPSLLRCLQTSSPSAIVIATGPEGGWTASEVEQAIEGGYQPVSLGCRILRTVTAPLTA
ncbi:MAG TPA: 16S rRNA (uracil(1498)-N(3))-methyltransferase, partial [Candidatus Caenarcaniphilales bacterium]